jgi:hypothetical protein
MAFAEHLPDPSHEQPSKPPSPRPAWLVGADDAMAEEIDDTPARPPRRQRDPLVEVEPESRPSPPPEPARRRPRDPLLEVESESRPASLEEPVGPVAWSAAASSIPRMPRRAGVTPIPSAARSDSELEDSDPALERNREDRWAQPPEAALPPLVEPWWVVLLDDLRTKRSTQLVAVACALAVAGLLYFRSSREAATIPLSKIRGNPALFDGRSVVVRGKIGEVYPVGGGYAFYLMQGRDTIVAFTTTRVPMPRQKVVVRGQVTTGFLDGTPRQALFESSSK